MKTKNIFFNSTFLLLFSLALIGNAEAAKPKLLFSDMTDGPVSGWNNSASKGAAVSIYCRNIGTTRGSSYVTVGGVALTKNTDYAEWGATTNPKVPLGMQRITFFLNSSMSTGGSYPNTTIRVTTSDGASTTIPFHTRLLGSNHIYIRNDQAAPGWGRANLKAGDTLYLRAGKYNTADNDSDFHHAAHKGIFSFCYGSPKNFNDGVEGKSITVAAYPGESVKLEAIDIENETPAHIVQVYYEKIAYWTLSKFEINALAPLEFKDDVAPPYDSRQTHLRFINLDITTPYFPNTNMEYYDYGETMAFYFGDSSSYIYVLGNYMHDVRADYRGQLPADPEGFRAYFMYLNGYGTMNHFEIGWNEFGWNAQSRGLQIFGHHEADRIDNLIIHDNWIHDTARQAIILSGEGGDYNYSFIQNAYIYNNIITKAGTGDSILQMGAMFGNGKHGGTYYVYNNVFDGSTADEKAVIHVGSEIDRLYLKNNIILGIRNNHDYFDYYPGDPISSSKVTADHNLYYGAGAGAKPSWDSSTLANNNPRFTPEKQNTFYDYLLESDSPVIGAGTTSLSIPLTTDFLSQGRGTPPTIGPLEFSDVHPAYMITIINILLSE
jgi:hypothetical protein